ncbi:ATP-binding protein [Microcoleus sp. FACHB-831]|uniref:ATP-binding protein n=1 Tax=Microcoleus sp. FACHB-831 TaxID=2692827 RepID=UPI001688FA6F|nr:helicase HerA-like domain-containing protein [Microcoleus sp. FACHB-831]MBD1922187.1 ATP-binding protein [Microcoleus sp. FACHB-831]
MTLIQIPDTINSDLSLISGYTFNEPELSANDFVIVEDRASHRNYFGQVVGPQANLNRSALGPQDNATINAFEQLEQNNYTREVVVKEVYFYQVNLIKDITQDPPSSVRRRPQIGSIARQATEEEIIKYLNLPDADERYRIGQIIDTNIGIYINPRTLFYQSLIAGATGSGKTNSCANYIRAALQMDFAVIIYDHKPDYQHINRRNQDAINILNENGQTDQDTTWIEGVNADFYYLGEDSTAFQGTPIAIPASEFDPAVLAAVMYYPPNETNSREEFETLLEEFDDERHADQNGNELVIWTLGDFFQWVTSNQDPWQPPGHARERFKGPQAKTYTTMVSKMLRRNRRPAWVDGGLPIRPIANPNGTRGRRSSPSAAVFGQDRTPQPPQWFDPTNLLQSGRALVIRVGQAGGGRDYGLFLNYMLKRVYDLKEQRQITFPVLHHIDEAQDLFNGSKQFASAIGNVLSEGVRKGRSRQIAFTIAVQSAAQIPDDILNNLNTRIIHRHNRASEAQRALEKAADAQISMTKNFGPGEALVDLFGASAVVNARMRLSPFQLTTEELLQQQEQQAQEDIAQEDIEF